MAERRVRLEERSAAPSWLVLRRWRVADAAELERVVAESAEHLRPWMGWMAIEPLTRADREAMLRDRDREWSEGGDVMLGGFLDGRALGSCGLHRRIKPDGLEIG
jgi:ribosomal-protein-serine acetyltransferase